MKTKDELEFASASSPRVLSSRKRFWEEFADEDFCCRLNGSDRSSVDREIACQRTRSSCSDRSPEKAQALVEQGIEPAIADVFDTDAVKAVVVVLSRRW